MKVIEDINKKSQIERVILVTNFPYSAISLLFDHVNGFVFTNGSILSHLGILLREEKKVAIIMSDAFEKLEEGNYYEIFDSRIIFA